MAWPATIRTWLAGEEPSAATLNEQIRDPLKAIGDAWTSYSPAWTSSTGTQPAIGNGSLTGQYAQAGKLTFWRFQLTSGTTTTYGTGNYTISLPFPMVSGLGYSLGTLVIQNPPATFYNRVLFSPGSTTVLAAADAAGTRWSQTSPFTPTAATAGYKFSAYGFYEAA